MDVVVLLDLGLAALGVGDGAVGLVGGGRDVAVPVRRAPRGGRALPLGAGRRRGMRP